MKIDFDTQDYCYWLPQAGSIIWAPGYKVVRAWWLRFNCTVSWWKR